MSQPGSSPADATPATYADLFRGGRAIYTVMIILGVIVHALQILVMAIIMPTVVADIGGASFYTWASMLYAVGAILGAAAMGPVWRKFGRRNGMALAGLGFIVTAIACALAPDMGSLVAARGLQGFCGGLVVGGSMDLVSAFFAGTQRARILSIYQSTWMVAQLLGPVVGGGFADFGWWRGSFWTMLIFLIPFNLMVWLRVPKHSPLTGKAATASFPAMRFMLLSLGVLAIAGAGPADSNLLRAAFILVGVALVWQAFRLDSRSDNRLYPAGLLSLRSPVGLALWIMFVAGLTQTGITLFLPLLLQVAYGVTPLLISYLTILISAGWTVGTFFVAGLTGRPEAITLQSGPLMMLGGASALVVGTWLMSLPLLTAAACIYGLGIGIHHVNLSSRTMAFALPGEESITASALPSIRSLGTAFGAATSGLVANMAGLGASRDAETVSHAAAMVFAVGLVPLICAALFMARFIAKGAPPATAKA
ncbi:MAG TPA: MFS transporter [Alphaproteobacteria bacterium]|nr:MFS transporter [Alphaproteobacteria bacterium]